MRQHCIYNQWLIKNRHWLYHFNNYNDASNRIWKLPRNPRIWIETMVKILIVQYASK